MSQLYILVFRQHDKNQLLSCRNFISLCLDSMIKPVVIMSQPDENSDDQLMLVVEVGKSQTRSSTKTFQSCATFQRGYFNFYISNYFNRVMNVLKKQSHIFITCYVLFPLEFYEIQTHFLTDLMTFLIKIHF